METWLYGGMKFPEKLDKVIADSGKSQSRIARETGISQSAISAMTRGDRRPYMDQALKLARALGVPLDYLADESLDELPAPELTTDDRLILRIVRKLEIDADEVIRRLYVAGPVGRPGDKVPVQKSS